jgi:hypothetical protein
VRFEGSRKVCEFRESDIIGPGFQAVATSKLKPGQESIFTKLLFGREVLGLFDIL